MTHREPLMSSKTTPQDADAGLADKRYHDDTPEGIANRARHYATTSLDPIEQEVRGILFRRCLQERVAGYVDEAAKEIAQAVGVVSETLRPVVDAPDAVERVGAILRDVWNVDPDDARGVAARIIAALPVQPGEREQIVAWHREQAAQPDMGCYELAAAADAHRHSADAIERGDFLPPQGTDDDQ